MTATVNEVKVSLAFKDAIKVYLDRMAEEDYAFYVKYTNDKKSIEECCNYILTQVKNSGQCGFHDDDIYSMAVHYYEEDTETLGKIDNIACNVVVNHVVELTEEEKEQARKDAILRYQNEALQELKKKYEKPKPVKTVGEVKEEFTLF